MGKYESAVKFLEATRFILKKVTHLLDAHTGIRLKVYLLLTYCHSTCFMQYVHLSKQSETKYGPRQIKPCVSWKVCLISIEQSWLWVASY